MIFALLIKQIVKKMSPYSLSGIYLWLTNVTARLHIRYDKTLSVVEYSLEGSGYDDDIHNYPP